ncbi:protein meaA [Desulfosarcina sp. OttesenSCG-928-A07]|nr:protein meaA [Desulfosarcina sp. OttesenSCG-928-G17]MDL2328974.1 protein meaA [Desulfosarcina sp. OttesenSCG-928-A07]
MTETRLKEKDKPWLMRTYSGYASAAESNQLYRSNLAKGQTGLSIAFDLPTQTGYDSDHPFSYGEVGKLGVPMRNLEDMECLFDQIPMAQMNTSMTINAPAAWLFALYLTAASRQNANIADLRGTLQNDILKEYLSRGTYIFPPAISMRLSAEVISYAVRNVPKWNPINICSYHLQESGATPVQELAFSLANAIAVLDEVKKLGQVTDAQFPSVVGRISFFLNAGIRFVEEMCKVRAFDTLWDRICLERYHVQDPKLRRFRYGIQVNSLGLSDRQPENNVARIIYEMLGVVLTGRARARSVQLPAWNEALGLPRKWDQQWSLRLQQILAFETDLLEYPDLFEGSPVIAQKEKELTEAATAELQKILEMGGAVAAIENGYMKRRLVESNAIRLGNIENGQQTVVGVNKFCDGELSPLVEGMERAFLTVDDAVEAEQISTLQAFRQKRDAAKVEEALDALKQGVRDGRNIVEVSMACAEAGVTTGEWTDALRAMFGEYRAPTGVDGLSLPMETKTENYKVIEKVKKLNARLGRNLKILIGKPGLDGHSNGAEQIAVKARDVGMEVVYEGIRLTPEQIAETALQEGVHVIGLSILSGSHTRLVPEVSRCLAQRGLSDLPIVLGGIIPEADVRQMNIPAVKKVYAPKDYQLNQIMWEIVDIVAAAHHIDMADGD